MSLDEWIDYTPTITAGSGTFTTVSTNYAKYKRVNGTTSVKFEINVTTNGTAATSIIVSAPFPALSTAVINGFEYNALSKVTTGLIASGASTFTVKFYDGGYPGGSSTINAMNGFYTTA